MKLHVKTATSSDDQIQVRFKKLGLRSVKIAGAWQRLPQYYLQAIPKKGFWLKITAEAKVKPEAYSSIKRI